MNPDAVNHRAELARLRELCEKPATEFAVLEQTIQLLNQVGYQDDVIAALRDSFTSPTPHPDAGVLWVRNKTALRQWGLGETLMRLMERGEIGRRAVIAYVQALGLAGRGKSLSALLKDHAQWLRGDPTGWNAVAAALGRCQKYWRALIWTRDWKQRDQADQEALYARALALRRWGVSAAANHMANRALAKPAVDELVHSQLLLWAAAEDAFGCRTERGEENLKRVNSHLLKEADTRIYRLVRSVLEVQAMPVGERAETLDNALKRIAKAFGGVSFWRRDLRTHSTLLRALVRLSLDARNPKPLLWGGWRFYGRAALTVLLCMVGIFLLPFVGLMIIYMPCCFIFIAVIAYMAVSQRRGG